MLRWGIMSAANIAYEQFLPAIQETTNQEIIAIASHNEEKMARFGIERMYDHYDALLADQDVDAVYIALPNSLHTEWAIKAAEAKKHILLEKPAALTLEDVEKIEKAVSENGVQFLEGFMYQYHPQHDIVRQWLHNGSIGPLNAMNAHFSFTLEDRDDIRLNKSLGGGAIWDIGCYGLHAATQIASIEPHNISVLADIDAEKEVDTTATIILQDEKHRLATVTCSFHAPFRNYYEIFGKEGSIHVEHAFRPDVAPEETALVHLYNKDGELVRTEKCRANQYTLQAEQFYAAIKEEQPLAYDIKQTKKMVELIEKLYRSLVHV